MMLYDYKNSAGVKNPCSNCEKQVFLHVTYVTSHNVIRSVMCVTTTLSRMWSKGFVNRFIRVVLNLVSLEDKNTLF